MVVITRAPAGSRTPLQVNSGVTKLSVYVTPTHGVLLNISLLDPDDNAQLTLQPGDEVEVMTNNGENIATHQVEEPEDDS